MDLKQGYKWLSRARNIDYQIKDKIIYIDSLYNCCGLQGISYDRISVMSSPENKFERIMAEIDQEKRELEDLRKHKEAVIREIKYELKYCYRLREKGIKRL